LLQIYCPLDEPDDAFHRMLYLFVCKRGDCPFGGRYVRTKRKPFAASHARSPLRQVRYVRVAALWRCAASCLKRTRFTRPNLAAPLLPCRLLGRASVPFAASAGLSCEHARLATLVTSFARSVSCDNSINSKCPNALFQKRTCLNLLSQRLYSLLLCNSRNNHGPWPYPLSLSPTRKVHRVWP
jgi:hypothetical protein